MPSIHQRYRRTEDGRLTIAIPRYHYVHRAVKSDYCEKTVLTVMLFTLNYHVFVQSAEPAGDHWRQSRITTRGYAAQLALMVSKSPQNSRCRRRSQPCFLGGRSPAMRTDAGHTPLKIRRRSCGKKYNERLIN